MKPDLSHETAANHPGMMARLANARPTHEQARQIIASAEAHRAFIASLCAGMPRAAGKQA